MARYIKQAEWIEIGKELLPAICVYCKRRNATQLAHALYHKRYFRSRKMHRYTDVEYNACPCCDECQQYSETSEGRITAFRWLGEKYGREKMSTWYHNFPSKIKEKFDV